MIGNSVQSTPARVWSRTLRFPRGCDFEEGCDSVADMLTEFDEYLSLVPGMDGDGAGELRLVCDEIVGNVLRHVSPSEDANVTVELETVADSVRLRIRDDGGDFDPFNQPQPYVGEDLEKRRVGGLGLYLIKRLFPFGTRRREGGWNVLEVEYCMGKDGKKAMGRES